MTNAVITQEQMIQAWELFALGLTDEAVAAEIGITARSAMAIRHVRNRAPELEDRLRAGDFQTLGELKRAAGFKTTDNRRGHGRQTRTSAGGAQIGLVHFGRGDPWVEVMEPLRRYLQGWRRRNFEFRHLNPKEAGERVAEIDNAIAGLEQARKDLLARSHRATYAAPGR